MSAVLIFGEVLFDCFEDGSRKLGGAPFNVAWHLQGLGMQAQLLSRVGEDGLGREILQSMQDWGMSLETLQTDPIHTTGVVSVTLDNSIPSFDIVADVAYDFIEQPESANLHDYKLLYHGSLALRSDVSRQTLLNIKNEISSPVFIDINLRPPHWDKTVVMQLLNKANWVKLNHEELAELSDANNSADLNLSDLAHRFYDRYGLDALIVTEGEKGAFILHKAGIERQKPFPVTKMKDTVGAGDAFSAMTIFGVLNNWSFEKILSSASMFASKVCELRGAVTTDRLFYEKILKEIA